MLKVLTQFQIINTYCFTIVDINLVKKNKRIMVIMMVSVEEFILEETSEVIQSRDIAMVYTNDE